jgi:hypothetical protein
VEKTEINKDGKRTYWFTQMKTPSDRIPMLVSGSLSMSKEEAEEMFNLIVENNGQMESEKVLKTINK